MKVPLITVVALASSLSASAQGTTNTQPVVTNVLAIYLVADQVPEERSRKSPPSPDEVGLAPTPVLADGDFLSCDLAENKFVITAAGAIKLGVTCAFRRVPYVLVAEGQRIYFGMFDTLVSSKSKYLLPEMTADFVLMDCFIHAPHKPEIPAEIVAAFRKGVVSEDLMALAKTKPTTNVVVTIPTFGDKRIAAAIAKLSTRSDH